MRILPIAAFLLPLSALAFSATAPQKARKRGETAAASSEPSRTDVTKRDPSAPNLGHSNARLQGAWRERFQQLEDFRQEHGHCSVPKRYQPNKPLANWVSKQRQEYRKFCQGEKASISKERIKALDQIGFCWNTQESPVKQDNRVERELDWKDRFQSLVEFMNQYKLSSMAELPRDSAHSHWISRQRELYTGSEKEPRSKLTYEKIRVLRQLDPHWHLTRREIAWETRYQELIQYAKENGHCCVPISYTNRKLAHWVSNQRKLYNGQLNGQCNSLDQERKQRLKKIGFVWNRWEHEFDSKQVQEGSFVQY